MRGGDKEKGTLPWWGEGVREGAGEWDPLPGLHYEQRACDQPVKVLRKSCRETWVYQNQNPNCLLVVLVSDFPLFVWFLLRLELKDNEG